MYLCFWADQLLKMCSYEWINTIKTHRCEQIKHIYRYPRSTCTRTPLAGSLHLQPPAPAVPPRDPLDYCSYFHDPQSSFLICTSTQVPVSKFENLASSSSWQFKRCTVMKMCLLFSGVTVKYWGVFGSGKTCMQQLVPLSFPVLIDSCICMERPCL